MGGVVGAYFNCSGNGSNSFCGWRNPAELAACREFFHCCLSHLNSITSRVSEPMLPPSSWQGWIWWLAFGLGPYLRHWLCITCLKSFWGRNMHLVGSGFFCGRVEWTGGERGSPQYRLGLCCRKPKAFRGRKVSTLVSPGRGESPTYSHVTPEK